MAGGLDGVSSLCLSLCCSQWLKELHGEKTASSSVQNRFKISSKTVRTDFEPISNRTNRFRTDFEPNNRFRTDFEPNSNRFRTDFEPKSNRFRTEPEPMSKRGGGLVANFPGTTCTALWGPAQVGWLMSSGTGVLPTWVHRNLRATLWLRGGGGWDALLFFGRFSGSLVGERLEVILIYIYVLCGVKCPKGQREGNTVWQGEDRCRFLGGRAIVSVLGVQ